MSITGLKSLLAQLIFAACLLPGRYATAEPVRLSIAGSMALHPLSQQLAI